jgi:hypothetical protein
MFICAHLQEELRAADHLCDHAWQALCRAAAAGSIALLVLLASHHIILRVPVLPHLNNAEKKMRRKHKSC